MNMRPTADGLRNRGASNHLLVPEAPRSSEVDEPEHSVHFYEDDGGLIEVVTEFLARGLLAGDPVLVIATPQHRLAFCERLTALGLDAAHACAAGQFVLLDADETMAKFMVESMPDHARFEETISRVLERLPTRSGAPIRAFGEMVDLLWRQGNALAAIRLEELWNAMRSTRAFTLMCAYTMASFYKESAGLRSVCATHTHIAPLNYEVATSDRDDAVAAPPTSQHVRALLAEIAQRYAAEKTLRQALRDLHHKEEALRESECQLRTVTDALPMLVSLVDSDQRYRYINAGYERWLSDRPETITGRHIRDVLGDAAYEQIRPKVEAALSGERVTFQARVPYHHGDERFIEVTYIPHTDHRGDVDGYVSLVVDISERKRLEDEREANSRRTERLMKITAAIAEAVLPEEVYEAVVDQVAVALGASSAGLWLLNVEEQSAGMVRSVGYSEAGKQRLEQVSYATAGTLPVVDAILGVTPIWIDSQAALLEAYPHLASMVTPGRSYRISCLPIVVHGDVLGAVGFTFDDAPPIDDDQRSFLLLVARYCGQALERLRLLFAERRSRARAEAAAARTDVLSRASQAFATAGADFTALLQRITEQVTQDVADMCSILLVSPDGRTLQPAGAHHRDPEAIARLLLLFESAPVRVGEGVAGRIAVTGECVFLPEVDGRAMLSRAVPEYREWVERYLPQSMIMVPLRCRGNIIGVLGATRQASSCPFTEEDKSLLEELAERAAMALESSRLAQENQQGRLRAELLYGLARSVIAAERVEHVFEAALDALELALHAHRSSILTFDAGGLMRFRAWRGLSDAYRQSVEGHSPWARDAQDPDPILVPDVSEDPTMTPYHELFRTEGIGALGFIPLVYAGRLIGKCMVYYERPFKLGSTQVDMAIAIANHVAAGVSRFAAVAELTETVRFNEMFTGILGHDLRNPLAAIVTAAQLATRRSESEKLVKPLARILNCSERMTRMIDQLLDFTRVRVGSGIPLEPKACDLIPILRQVMDELDDANPGWTLHLEHSGNTLGTWDMDRLCQVFSNLIANAVQHGVPGHGVKVHVDGRRGDQVRVEIHNMGAVPAGLIPMLFEPLTGSERRRDGSRGLGLGLYITREIVKAHGGSIAVESTEEAGTTFKVSLPRGVAPVQPAE